MPTFGLGECILITVLLSCIAVTLNCVSAHYATDGIAALAWGGSFMFTVTGYCIGRLIEDD